MLDVVERQWRVHAGDESATPLKRALRCAQLAENEGASAPLIAAALLHDIARRDDQEGRNNGQADERAEHVLAKWFGPEVCEPVRLLPEARRYLSAVEPGYIDGLSRETSCGMMRDGGPMSGAEATAFEAEPYAGDALRLLRWTDCADTPDGTTGSLAYFLRYAVDCTR